MTQRGKRMKMEQMDAQGMSGLTLRKQARFRERAIALPGGNKTSPYPRHAFFYTAFYIPPYASPSS